MQTFLCLVDLFCAVIAGAPARHVQRWLTTLIENVAALVAAHPLLSGFYKIARVALVAADDAGVFEQTDAFHSDVRPSFDAFAAKETCRAFLLDVLAGAERLSDELRAAALQLLLSAPAGLLSARELAPALRDALAVGAHHPPLAHAALDVLDRWTGTRGTLARSSGTHDTQNGSHRRESTRHRAPDREEIRALLPSMARSLRAYVDRRGASEKTDAGGDASFDAENLASGLNAGDAYRSARRAAESARAADRSAEPEHDIDTRVARVLGAVGGAAHALIDDDDRRARSSGASASASSTLWDFERRVSLDVEVGENARVTIWLDRMLPRAAHCALSSTDRAAKVAAAEFLHAATLLMVGRNARAFAPEGGDHAREATPFHKIYRRLFPAVLELAIDQEPVCRQLFSALATQLVRWFTRNQAREAAETVALLDAVVEGLAGDPARRDAEAETEASFQKTAFPGTLPGKLSGGAAARRRDLCASLAAECLKWSVRSVPSGDLRGGGGAPRRGGAGPGDGVGQSVAVNVSSLLRRLFAFQTHPDPSRRLGAATALRLCLAELRMFPEPTKRTRWRSSRRRCGACAWRIATRRARARRRRARSRACGDACVRAPRRRALPGPEGQNVRGGARRLVRSPRVWFPGSSRTASRAGDARATRVSAGVRRARAAHAGYVSPRAWVAAARAKVGAARAKQSPVEAPTAAIRTIERGRQTRKIRLNRFGRSASARPRPSRRRSRRTRTRLCFPRRGTLREATSPRIRARANDASAGTRRGLDARRGGGVALGAVGARTRSRRARGPASRIRRKGERALRRPPARRGGVFPEALSAFRSARDRGQRRRGATKRLVVLAGARARARACDSPCRSWHPPSRGARRAASGRSSALSGGARTRRKRRTKDLEADPGPAALSQLDQPSRGGVARLACAAALAPVRSAPTSRAAAWTTSTSCERVRAVPGADGATRARRVGAPASRATLRHALAYHPRFDLGAADARSAEGPRAARRLAAGYRAPPT